MKILNLYAGIGGNRKLWGDAHDYLLKHFKEFDFIWSSPPCQSHSKTNFFLSGQGIYRYPKMELYQEILFLKHWFKGKWLVENVIPYYKPLIAPTKILGRHQFWANFDIADKDFNYVQIGIMNRSASKDAQRRAIIREAQIPELLDLHGLKDFKIKNKRQVLRNCVLPETGLHIINQIK